MSGAERRVWLDSLVQQWPNGIVPIWSLHQDEPMITADDATTSVAKSEDAAESARLVCPPMLEIPLPDNRVAPHFNEENRVTEIFCFNNDYAIDRFEVDSTLGYTVTTIPVDSGGTWLAEDLDQDGDVELIIQFGDELKIFSAPDWEERRRFVFPGMAIVMYPTTVNIDDDPYLEIYVTPNTMGEDGMPTIIKYDEPSDSFKIIFQMWAPNGALGQPAVGDFDEDGRMEFISGNNFGGGYELFEWQDPILVHISSIGEVGEPTEAAVACHPKPNGKLHALLGHSGFRYELFEPTGDNTFSLVHAFDETTGWHGGHPCWAADTDCDGLDELAMSFHPNYRVWEWDANLEDFVLGCEWDAGTYGTTYHWYTVDLDQNGAPEWGSTHHPFMFKSFPDPDCAYCDASGRCSTMEDCACACNADPDCNGVTDVLDVVQAVNVAFRNASSEADPFFQCPAAERTDVNCTDDTDVLDVVRLVNVAFRNGDPAVEFCDPCAP